MRLKEKPTLENKSGKIAMKKKKLLDLKNPITSNISIKILLLLYFAKNVLEYPPNNFCFMKTYLSLFQKKICQNLTDSERNFDLSYFY